MGKIRGLAEVVISVHDMKKSVNFYRDIIGLTIMSSPDIRGAVFLLIGEQPDAIPQQLVLIPLPEGTDPFPDERIRRPMHHFGIEIAADEFESERERLQSLGYNLRFGEHPFLHLKGMYLDDPDGNEIELIATKA